MEAARQGPRVLSPNKANAGELLIMAFIESWFGIQNSVNCKAHRNPQSPDLRAIGGSLDANQGG
jgi:hypothetical protein